ncbi:MAG: DUF4386 domain-containing protein [Dehalococcoidia bacterium]|nr:DUF4386 domain-containing protein [Dehalococcoidia bacterium]
MNTYKKTAISVGVLFIVATVTNMLGNLSIKPILDAPDYLIQISANENLMIIASLLVLISAFASASIAIWLYPILKKHHKALALGSVGFRLMEGMLIIIGVVALLSLLTLSQEYVRAGASNASLYQVSGTLLQTVKTWAGQLSVLAFITGAMMYYYVFYQSKLVPRWLSGWGFLGAALSLASAVLAIFGLLIPLSTVFILFNLVILVQEMVLAVWLIVKGFNQSAIASGSAKTATN